MTATHAPLARHLARFSAPAAVLADLAEPQAEFAAAILVPSEPTVTLTMAALDARLAAARDEVRATLEASHEADRARVAADGAEAAERALTALRAEHATHRGEEVATQIGAAVTALRDVLGRQVAAALRPLLAEAVAVRALAAVGDAIERALADPGGAALVVRGPAPLLAVVAARFAGSVAVRFEDGDGAEVTVTGGDISVTSRLAEALQLFAVEETA